MRFITFFLFFSMITACQNTDTVSDCRQFHTGKFIFKSGNPVKPLFSIVRDDSIQVETNLADNSVTKLAITWTDTCAYELRLLETTLTIADSMKNVGKTAPLRSEILSWTKQYYIFRTTSTASNKVLTDTMWVGK